MRRACVDETCRKSQKQLGMEWVVGARKKRSRMHFGKKATSPCDDYFFWCDTICEIHLHDLGVIEVL